MRKRHEDITILAVMRLGVGAGVDDGEKWNNTVRGTPGLCAEGLGLTTLHVLHLPVIMIAEGQGLDRYKRCQLRKRTYIDRDRPERSLR